jgi:hypothetical protein
MALHDAYARLTPFELAFPDDGERLISAVQGELGEGADPGDVRTFLTLSAVGAFLEETRAEDTGVEAVHPFGMLAYHAFHFVRAGRRVLLLAEGLARRLVRDGGNGAEPRLPAEAGYVQLPQHLFWMPGGEGVPESIDGFFWTRSRDGLLHLLLAMGMRRDRAGLVVAPVPDAPWSEAESWPGARVRRESDDFSSTLPGSELEELYSFEMAGEVLKLMARLAAYLHETPAAAVQRTPGDAPPEGPPASRLPYQRIVLVDPEERRHDG